MPHDQPSAPITYLATHLPAVSHTFIVDEIEALERIGVAINKVAINHGRTADLHTDDHDNRQDSVSLTTAYLKATPRWRTLLSVATAVLLHPTICRLPWRGGAGGARARLWRYLQLAEAILLYRIMRRAGSTHVHAHFGGAPATIAWYATEVARRHRTRRSRLAAPTWSMTVHGWHEFTAESDSMLSEKLTSAKFVVAISDYTRAQLYRLANEADWDRIHVVRCGIDLQRFPSRAARPSNTPPRIVMTARVAAEKGHLVLVDALAILRARGLDLVVDAIGPEVDVFGDVVRARADAVGVSNCIEWHGALSPSQVTTKLNGADLFCLPTFAEGLPVVIMEAMAIGLPVITTYVAGIPELAIDRKTALVVPPARADRLAEAISDLLADTTLRETITAGASTAVRQQHNIHDNVLSLARLFRGEDAGGDQ